MAAVLQTENCMEMSSPGDATALSVQVRNIKLQNENSFGSGVKKTGVCIRKW